MSLVWRVAPWFSRVVLLVATLVLALIGRKFITDPVGAAAASTMVLGSPLAITNMRASFGAFPLGCAIFTLTCVVLARRRITGLYFVATVIGTALAVRLYGVVTDGTLAASVPVLVAEAVLVILSVAALYLERAGASPEADANGRGSRAF
jgi:Domain of unknown function (DUF4345)